MTLSKGNLIANVAALLVCFIMIFPVFSTVVLSFKQQADVSHDPPLLFPCNTETENFNVTACRFFVEGYERIISFKEDPDTLFGYKIDGRIINTYLPNTIFYTVATAILVTVFSGLAGYVFSRYEFAGKRLIMIGILAITGIPLLTNLLALFQLVVDARKFTASLYEAWQANNTFSEDTIVSLRNWQDRILLVMIYVGFFLPFSVWIVKSFFDAIPIELEEAAYIDGASPYQALTQIITPLAMPGLVSSFLLTFVGVWNEFIANYLIVGSSKPALRSAIVGIYDLTGNNLINYQVLAAACVLVMLPVVLVFLFTRRTFFNAMTEGAVKG
jgi:multiple sugar transport system permease protein